MSKLGLFQGSALEEALSTNHDFVNSHGVIKGCFSGDLLMVYVLKIRLMGLEY